MVDFHKELGCFLFIYPQIKYVSKLDRYIPYQYNERNY